MSFIYNLFYDHPVFTHIYFYTIYSFIISWKHIFFVFTLLLSNHTSKFFVSFLLPLFKTCAKH